MTRTAAGPLTVDQARKAYATILVTLSRERAMREKFLADPRKSLAIQEIDAALDALLTFGDVVNLALDAGLLAGEAGVVVSMQAPLLDVGKVEYP